MKPSGFAETLTLLPRHILDGLIGDTPIPTIGEITLHCGHCGSNCEGLEIADSVEKLLGIPAESGHPGTFSEGLLWVLRQAM